MTGVGGGKAGGKGEGEASTVRWVMLEWLDEGAAFCMYNMYISWQKEFLWTMYIYGGASLFCLIEISSVDRMPQDSSYR